LLIHDGRGRATDEEKRWRERERERSNKPSLLNPSIPQTHHHLLPIVHLLELEDVLLPLLPPCSLRTTPSFQYHLALVVEDVEASLSLT
jgi:hypothetical protein